MDKTSLNKSELCGSSGEQKTESLFSEQISELLGAAELFQLKNFSLSSICRPISTKNWSQRIYFNQFRAFSAIFPEVMLDGVSALCRGAGLIDGVVVTLEAKQDHFVINPETSLQSLSNLDN